MRPPIVYVGLGYVIQNKLAQRITFVSLSKLYNTQFVFVSHKISLVRLFCVPRLLRPGAIRPPVCPLLVTSLT